MSSSSSPFTSSLPQAIQYCEEDEHTKSKTVCGPVTYQVFENRDRSNEWPSINHKTQIWNGNEVAHWTPIFVIDSLFKKLEKNKTNSSNHASKSKPSSKSMRLNQGNNHNNNRLNHKKHQRLNNKDAKSSSPAINGSSSSTSISSTSTTSKTKTKSMHNKQRKRSLSMHWSELYEKYKRHKHDVVTYVKTSASKLCRCLNCCNWSPAPCELFKWLIISRVCIFIFGIGIVYILDISPFDSSSLLLNNRVLEKVSHSWMDRFCLQYLNPFSHWDAQYFLHIAQYGYEHEKIYAFYPGLPLIINSIILFIRRLITGLHFKSMALICGIVWNGFISTYFASIILYYLTIKIYNKPSIALITAKLFLINPASIFFCAIYTESTFAFVSFLLMLCCELKYFDCNHKLNPNKANNSRHSLVLLISIMLCILIACSLRSNGIIIIGFPIYYHIYTNWFVSNHIMNALSFVRYKIQSLLHLTAVIHGEQHEHVQTPKKKPLRNGYAPTHRNKAEDNHQQQQITTTTNAYDTKLPSMCTMMTSVMKLVGLICLLFIGLTPWVYYQYWSKRKLCDTTDILNEHRSYCTSMTSTVYSFVQSTYWQCGFLMRWNSNEIGNFLLAMPMWFISYHAIRHYIEQFNIISSVSCVDVKYLTSSLWSTFSVALKKMIKLSSSTNNEQQRNQLIQNGKTTTRTKRGGKAENGTIFSIASGLQLLKSMGMIEHLSNSENDHDKEAAAQAANNQFESEVLLHHKLIPYVIYWAILWLVCVFYAHVQISTRFICCSCPALYWFCAEIIYLSNRKQDKNNNHQSQRRKASSNKKWIDSVIEAITSKPTPRFIVAYFLLYFTLGTLAFCAYLPFV